MKKIAYTELDGSVSIVIPVAKTEIERILGSLTDEEYVNHVKEKSIPAHAQNVVDIDDLNIPSTREFRAAWKLVGNKIDFDLVKAKEIQLGRVRFARESKLSALDVLFMQAVEKGDTQKQAEIAAQKQFLRDITEPLKALDAKSIDDIKNAFPQELKS